MCIKMALKSVIQLVRAPVVERREDLMLNCATVVRRTSRRVWTRWISQEGGEITGKRRKKRAGPSGEASLP